MADHISPTYASGTFSIISDNSVMSIVKDYYNRSTALTGSTVTMGYVNVIDNEDVGGFNSDKNDIVLSKAAVTNTSQS